MTHIIQIRALAAEAAIQKDTSNFKQKPLFTLILAAQAQEINQAIGDLLEADELPTYDSFQATGTAQKDSQVNRMMVIC